MKLPQVFTKGLTRAGLAVALGWLWVLDGFLQLQPRMFSPDFANQVLSPAAVGQPAFVAGPMSQVVKLVLTHPMAINATFAGIQLLLGVAILWPKTRRLGLALSVVWALLVWYLGEGLGGLFGGQASLVTGFPGAALLYGILAVGAYPGLDGGKRAGHRPQAWLNLAWLAIWIGGAVYQLLPGQNSAYDIASAITSGASGAPAWLGSINSHAAILVSDSQLWLVVALALVMAAIGIGAFMPDYIRRRALYVGMSLSLIFWIVGQDFGAFYSGLATDPNAGPLLILFGLALLGSGALVLWPKDI
jgi:hypothetical protein